MTRQLDIQAELRETSRRDTLVKALEFGLVGALETKGFELRGIAIRYRDYDCLLTVKATIDERWVVAHVGSDTIMNCLLKTYEDARYERLRWSKDKYQPSGA